MTTSSLPQQQRDTYTQRQPLHFALLAGIPVTSMREIRVLQQCRHPNIVHLKKVVTGSKPDRCANQPLIRCCLLASHLVSAGTAVIMIYRQAWPRAPFGCRRLQGSTHSECMLLQHMWLLCCALTSGCHAASSWCLSTAPTTWASWWMPCPGPSAPRRSSASCCRYPSLLDRAHSIHVDCLPSASMSALTWLCL